MIPLKEFIESSPSCLLVRTDFKVDIAPIVDFFDSEILLNKKTYQSKQYGGWSIQSNSGEISDGWQAGGTALTNGLTKEQLRQMFVYGNKFQNPTKLYQGPVEKLINDLTSKNFNPKRTRFAELEPHTEGPWHQDGSADIKRFGLWRSHIAVKTNPDALFQFRSQDEKTIVSYHIPADGYLYLVNINQMHRIENKSDQSRIHIITDSAQPIKEFLVNVEPILSL